MPNSNPQRPPQQIEIVDPRWLLKALGLMLTLGILCALATIVYYHHYQTVHSKPAPTNQTTPPHPAAHS